MKTSEGNGSRRISVDLPENLISKFDELKKEWGLRARGAVLKRLLEVIFQDGDIDQFDIGNINKEGKSNISKIEDHSSAKSLSVYDENTALVLISSKNDSKEEDYKVIEPKVKTVINPTNSGIDLPGFVKRSTENLRESLNKQTTNQKSERDPLLTKIRESDITESLDEAFKHWISLYGHKPGETVIEAAMIWLARDIWSHSDQTLGEEFTWSLANYKMKNFCPNWSNSSPTFERILVIAGVLEDPFATNTLSQRMPTLIRRFVNQYKRRRNVTSFETIETTMTVHRALKLLDLPTKAGSALTLKKIRDSYKFKAMSDHPDAGGSTESMRRLNEAYQLLKELYRNRST